MKTYIIVLLVILFNALNIYAQDNSWQFQKRASEIEWKTFRNEIQNEWNQEKAEIQEKWQKFILSTQTQWVDYNQNKDARSRVDFKKGKIFIETVIPKQKSDKNAWERIVRQAQEIFNKKDISGNKVLENQVVSKKQGNSINSNNVEKFLNQDIKHLKPPVYFKSKDGLKRKKYTVEIDMVNDHIQIRAKKFLPIVMSNALRFKIKPELILSIIHAESYFNPFAVSDCGAIGIMQLIPKFGGREAYRFIYKQDKVVPLEYLYNPENNIELGCAYLHILKYVYFKKVREQVKNDYLSICGYNWGPTAMRKKILNRYSVLSMTDSQLYLLLIEKTPKETSNYIKKVLENMRVYDFVK